MITFKLNSKTPFPSTSSGQHALLVTGLGPVGLAAALVARAMGVRRVYGTDANAYRLRFALDKVCMQPGSA